jgi:fermentation-respiration switch protein FrsA (DUF1100 family)
LRLALFFVSLYLVNQNAILFDFSIPLSMPNFPHSLFLSCATFLSIPAVHIRSDERKFTIIYSHGNAEDVGLSLPYLDHLSQCCDCNILAYEYCGYSIAEGEPSEKNCYECIDAAYRYLAEGRQSFYGDENCTSSQKQHRSSGIRSPVVDPSRIVLFGRSLGTGPTVDLAARLLSENDENDCSLAAVILQSPLVIEIISRFDCMNII